MNNDIRVSVVVPTYNRERTIIRCINSIINQSYQAFEIIVVDDGSTDNTIQKIKSLNCEYLYILKQNHRGAQAARNLGVINANGDYVSFLDSDDEWVPTLLEEEVKYIKRGYDDCVIYSDCYRDYGEQKRDVWNLPGHSGNMYPFLLGHSGPMLQSLLVKRNYLMEIGLLDESLPAMQEWDTYIRLSKEHRVIHVKKPLFIYHLESTDSISKDTLKSADGYLNIVLKHMKEIKKNCGCHALIRHFLISARINLKIRRIDKVILCILEALRIPFV